MTLIEAIKQTEEYLEKWPGGINFKLKSKLIGIETNDLNITTEMLNSKDWGICFESYDDEFNSAVTCLMENLK
jgi:hypothetical protein